MSRIISRLIACCLVFAVIFSGGHSQSGDRTKGLSEEEFYFLFELGLVLEAEGLSHEATYEEPFVLEKPTQKPSRTNGLSGTDLGSGRIRDTRGTVSGSGW